MLYFLRKAVKGIGRDLQQESLERLQAAFSIRQFPPLSLNHMNLTQEIFRALTYCMTANRLPE